METANRANQLSPEHLEAMQSAALLAAEIEVERDPRRVGTARIAAEDVEILFPLGVAVFPADRLGQRPVEGVTLRNAKQGARRIVHQRRQLLQLIVEQPVAESQIQLTLDRPHARQVTEDDLSHGR